MPGGVNAACRGHNQNRGGSGSPAHYLSMSGSGGASAPSNAGTEMTGSLEIEWDGALDDYTPGTTQDLVTRSAAGGNNRAYAFYLKTDGTLALDLSQTGTAYSSADSGTPTGWADGTRARFKVTWDTPTGDTKFYTSTDGSVWTQLGITKSIGLPSISNTASPSVRIGSRDAGSTNNMSGKTYRGKIRSGIGGTVVFDADFTSQATGAGSFTESSSGAALVTINAPASIA